MDTTHQAQAATGEKFQPLWGSAQYRASVVSAYGGMALGRRHLISSKDFHEVLILQAE